VTGLLCLVLILILLLTSVHFYAASLLHRRLFELADRLCRLIVKSRDALVPPTTASFQGNRTERTTTIGLLIEELVARYTNGSSLNSLEVETSPVWLSRLSDKRNSTKNNLQLGFMTGRKLKPSSQRQGIGLLRGKVAGNLRTFVDAVF